MHLVSMDTQLSLPVGNVSRALVGYKLFNVPQPLVCNICSVSFSVDSTLIYILYSPEEGCFDYMCKILVELVLQSVRVLHKT